MVAELAHRERWCAFDSLKADWALCHLPRMSAAYVGRMIAFRIPTLPRVKQSADAPVPLQLSSHS